MCVERDSDGTMTATARVAGRAGNSIAIAEAGTHTAWAGGATALSGGEDLLITTSETLADETDQFRAAASDAIMVRAGVADPAVVAGIRANPLRGYKLLDLANGAPCMACGAEE